MSELEGESSCSKLSCQAKLLRLTDALLAKELSSGSAPLGSARVLHDHYD